jgi:Tol biopolymer transport system component
MTRITRLISAMACALTLIMLPLTGSGRAHMCTPDTVIPIEGTLLVPQSSGLARFSLSERIVEPLPILPSVGIVGQVARSHDGSRLAVARFSRPESDPIGGADILMTGPHGGAILDRIERAGPGEMLSAPAWHPRGGLVFERATVTDGMSSARIDWRRADADVVTLVDHGGSPAISPDGNQIVFVDATRGDRLLTRQLDTANESVLVENNAFLTVAFPRFSPGGDWVAFSAVGEPVGLPVPYVSTEIAPGPRAAVAHGIPWDAWAVHVSTGELRRLSSFSDDDPAVAWSPDGRWVAMFAAEAVSLVALDGSASYCVLSTGGYGGFEWL